MEECIDGESGFWFGILAPLVISSVTLGKVYITSFIFCKIRIIVIKSVKIQMDELNAAQGAVCSLLG